MTKENQYTVLARKYRPQTFSTLIGQDALVQTLTNAIKQERIAHAYLLTGIRGVGKTSTARIIAKALICGDKDKNSKATPEPCGVCANCIAVSESRHVDVLEMDAASRTGVSDIREITDSANYLPSAARYKIFIIDEVHMLSKSAFNALLKTLEEPPPHVIFIFATTEVRKIPVTILSRCQRFDLPRIDLELLRSHLKNICEKESVKFDDDALTVIAKVSEGSVRDALSLLDQAIAYSGTAREVEFTQVNKMLGLLGKEKLLDLFSSVSSGEIKLAITIVREMYHAGADPVSILQDLLELSHLLTQIKVMPDLSDSPNFSREDFAKARSIAEKLDVPFLSRVWQMLVKGVQEANIAANSLMAAEMILVRISYSSSLPNPGDLIKKIQKGDIGKNPNPAPEVSAPTKVLEGALLKNKSPNNFAEMVEMFKDNGELFLYNWLQNEVHPVQFEKGKLEIRLTDSAPRDLPNRVMACLNSWTGNRWLVIVSNEEGEQTIKQQREQKSDDEKTKAANDKDVLAILQAFPGAKINNIYPAKDVVENTESEISKKSGEQK